MALAEQMTKPPPSFTVGGFRSTGRVRIRIGFFFFPVVEELYEYSDGSVRWKRLGWLETVNIKDARCS